jgi:hypothetical protein
MDTWRGGCHQGFFIVNNEWNKQMERWIKHKYLMLHVQCAVGGAPAKNDIK